MNYKHAYHAGNFADVMKHVILIALLNALTRKDTPLCYLDTHAGEGYFDLYSEHAAKSKEYINGIEKIIHAENPPLLVQQYLNCIHQINNQMTHAQYNSLQYYPGSPLIARYCLRPHDRIIACELQQDAYQVLRNTFAGDKQVAVHHQDGFLGLKAFLPPKERRGLILIDPPYEDPDEFSRIARSLGSILKRFAGGVYAIWYPIKDKHKLLRFYQSLKQEMSQVVFTIELTIYPDLPQHLNGCGMAIINPPWQFDQDIQACLPWLWNALTIKSQGGFWADFLK
jgi:23S rRNA (adenine2030-N6)-methyltransferase